MLLQQSMNQSIQIFKSHTRAQEKPHTSTLSRGSTFCVSIYKILFHFNALLWESIILVFPPPPSACKAYSIAIRAIVTGGQCDVKRVGYPVQGRAKKYSLG